MLPEWSENAPCGTTKDPSGESMRCDLLCGWWPGCRKGRTHDPLRGCRGSWRVPGQEHLAEKRL
uniref:Uncharacterized protein n=1 Tax=Anguilla anguilla TaxID=7936 RepID=A0A0E9S1F4_ANGAN